MRGKIAVAVIVVLACALFLVPYASAAKLTIIDTWVEGPSGEVLDEYTYVDVKGPCTYKVKVGIEGTSFRPILLTANLAFGPNYGNENCQKYKPKDGKIDLSEATTTIAFANIRLLPLANCDEAFKEFVDGKGGWKWEECWYKFDVESTMFEGDEIEIEMGIPVLTNVEVIYYNSDVEQNRVYKDLSFDYHVKVWANCEDNIELQVRNYTSGRWDKHGLQNYTEPLYTNKTLTWLAVNLTPDNFDSEGHGQYTFVANISNSRPEKPYSGPTIEERFKDPKVSYKKTINELLLFDYEVSVEIDQIKDSIMLEVYNYALRDWEEKGIRNYTTPGKYQKLKWESIILSYDYFDGNSLRGEYQFVGKYNRSKNVGPEIKEKFYDLLVTPTQGKNNVTFNYSVTVNANISDKIELQVKNHTNNGWYSKGTRDYTTPKINETLRWHNLQLNTHELNRHNDSIFRFVGKCGVESSEKGSSLPIWPINPFFENLSVKPERGLYSENFYYSVDVKAEKNGIVNLSIFCPDGSLLCETKLDYNKAPEWQTLNWSVQKFNGCDVKTGDAGFRFGFWYKGSEIINRTKEGPYIGIAKFGNEAVEPEIGTKGTRFNYTINVSAAHGGTVELLIKCPEGTHWDTGGEKKYDSTSGIRKTLKWTRIELPCDICGNAEYMFKFESGHVLSENYTGPELIEEEFGELFVTPKEGTCSTPFNFSIDFSTSKQGNVPVTLQVSLDEAAGDAYWEDVAIKRYENDIPGSQIPVNFTVCMAENEVTENLASAWVTNKVIYWRVKGLVNVSIPIPTTYDINLTWYNSSVSQEEGRWYDPFSFNVSLSAIENGTVALQVKLNGSDSDWQNRGKTYNYARPDRKSFTWLNEPICNDSFAGNTWYRFEFTCGEAPYYSNKSGLDGPKLFIPLNISFTDDCVEEKEDVIFSKTFGGLFNETSNTFFNFSINVTANDTTAVDLILVDPNNNSHPERDYKSYTEPPQQLPFTWTQKELPLAEIGNWRYNFSYNDPRKGSLRYNETFEGPRIIAVFKNYTIEPYPILFNRTHKVTVFVTGTIPMEVELEAFNLNQNERIWDSLGTRNYVPSGEQLLNWTINTFDIPFDNLRLNWKKKENGE